MPDVAMPDLEDLHMCSTGPVSQVSRPVFQASPYHFCAQQLQQGWQGSPCCPGRRAGTLDLPGLFRQPEP